MFVFCDCSFAVFAIRCVQQRQQKQQLQSPCSFVTAPLVADLSVLLLMQPNINKRTDMGMEGDGSGVRLVVLVLVQGILLQRVHGRGVGGCGGEEQ